MTKSLELPDDATMYRAFVERDRSFEGVFCMGVRTTGIFCRPGCPARTPNRENVEFFPRAGDALAAGFRPCKRCMPMQPSGCYPDWLAPLMAAIDDEPLRRWTGQDLREAGVDPARARRWFQKNHNMTFMAYLRSRRLGQAFSRIQEGSVVMEAAREADFDSVSGFCEAIRKKTGTAPTKGKERKVLYVAQVSSPLGPIMVAGDEQSVWLVEFWDRRMLEAQFEVLEKRVGAVFFPGETATTRRMGEEIGAYFAGELTEFKTPIRFPGSEHQMAVWRALLDVPSGETWTYGELAEKLGKAKAVRSVARAVGENRFAIVIPCHRIVGADGKLTGYGGGIWRKRCLLQHEREAAGASVSG